MSSIGDRVRQRREELGLTVEGLEIRVALKAGFYFRPGTIAAIEAGRSSCWLMVLADFVALCRALDCSTDWLLGRCSTQPQPSKKPDVGSCAPC
jgi:transcriptional regulator with XRE-family HTH domain